MQKHIIPVLVSFFSVIVIILLGTNIAFRTNIIPDLEEKFSKEREKLIYEAQKKDAYIETLQNELELAQQRQIDAEKKLAEKLEEEERIALEKAQAEQAARLAAQQAAADAAAQAAEKSSSSSKKSKAS